MHMSSVPGRLFHLAFAGALVRADVMSLVLKETF
jgi:hypothetical protein